MGSVILFMVVMIAMIPLAWQVDNLRQRVKFLEDYVSRHMKPEYGSIPDTEGRPK